MKESLNCIDWNRGSQGRTSFSSSLKNAMDVEYKAVYFMWQIGKGIV